MLTSAEITTANTLPIRKVGQKLAVGWNKTIAYTEGWFTLDESVLDGPDLLGWNADKPFNPAMAYELTDISTYAKRANLERGVQFPYAVQSATADFELVNDQRRFSGSPYLYPARPLRWWVGIAGSTRTALEILGDTDQDTEPAPTPDDPQAVQSVTGSQSVEIDGATYTIDLGSIELHKIGTKQDRIYYDGSNWYLEKNVASITFDGSESWNAWNLTANPYVGFYCYAVNGIITTDGYELMLNNTTKSADFIEPEQRRSIANGELEGLKHCGSYSPTTTPGPQYIAISVSKQRLSNYSSKANAITSFKTWLGSHNVTVYYSALNSTTTQITNAALIAQLDAVYSAMAGETIDQTMAGGQNLGATLHNEYSHNQSTSLLPLFDGFTNGVATYSGTNEQSMSLTAMDLLAMICDRTLPNMYMATEVRTDEIIRSILVDELGVGEYLLNLEQGDVVIPFVWWEAGKSVASALKSVVQAENGRLWVDEQGYICFAKTGLNELTTASVATFNSANIISATTGSADRIVNECHITTGIREVQPRQMVYSEENENGYQQAADEDTYRIAASTSTTFWIQLEDPCTSIDTPLIRTARSDVASYFVATNLSGTAVASGLSIEDFLVFGNRVMLTISNANAYAMSLREIKLWGTPARVVQEVDYTAKDDDSINSYGRKLLEITDNELWGTAENVRSYARTIVQTSAAYEQSLTLEVRSNILLQVGDVVEVQLPSWNAAQRFAVETIKLGIDSPKNCAIKQTLSLVATAAEEE